MFPIPQMSRKKLVKRGTILTCAADIENFTKGKDYKVLGNAPKYKLIIKDDRGKTAFPRANQFKRISLLQKLYYFLKLKKL